MANKPIRFIDLLALHVIMEYTVENPEPPSRKMIWNLINGFIQKRDITVLRASPIESEGAMTYLIERLVEHEAIEKQGRSYTITDKGKEMLNRAPRGWRFWPLEVPVHPDGTLDWDNAKYP